MNNIKGCKKYNFEHEDEVFTVVEAEMKTGLPGIIGKHNGENRILLNVNLSEEDKQKEFNRLIAGENLINIITGEKVDFKNSSFTDNAKQEDPLDDDDVMDQVKLSSRYNNMILSEAMKLMKIFKEIEKVHDGDRFSTLIDIYNLGVINGKREERARRKKVSVIKNEFNRIKELSLCQS